MHCHNAVELIRATQGEIFCHIGDLHIPMTVGMAILVIFNVLHCLETKHSVKVNCIQIDVQRYQKSLDDEDQIHWLAELILQAEVKVYETYAQDSEMYRLIEGTSNMTETAFACGFVSVQYFTQVFKKYRGCVPSVYKKEL